ncbi:MAG TPA: hydantoinase B/oxoprolinase family protein, partial [Conexibacter sp.]|nr:hydantoinase B/oxoprolinase family protein [Conexibacter sp.]
HRDGLSPQGHRNIIAGKAPNVESLELIMPVLYLHRRLLADTPGAGCNRGGQSSGAAYMVHDVDSFRVLAACHGYTVPTAPGLWGGLPAATNVHRLYRDTDVRAKLAAGELVTEIDQLTVSEELLSAKPPVFEFGHDDVYEWGPQGGGGWGDPLLRAPERVAADVRDDAVTVETARLAYGVVVDADGTLDAAATAALREQILAARRAWPAAQPPLGLDAAAGRTLAPVGDQLSIVELDGERYWACDCGSAFAHAHENPKQRLGTALAEPADLGTRVTFHAEIEVRRSACTSCGRLHFAEVARHDDPPLFDVRVEVA